MKRISQLALLFLSLISALAVFAPQVTRYSYDEQNLAERLETPSYRHWMGTDSLGRDLYSRVIYGARVSLSVGFFTALFALVLGTLTGALAGYLGGWIDQLLMRIIDLFYIFPSLLMAILLSLLFGRGIIGIVLSLGMAAWVTHARLVRAQFLQARELPYVESAKAIGARPISIVTFHILPNLIGPMIVSLTAQIPNSIMAESFLSFLGLGIQPPHSSWGTLANEGFRAMQSFPHLIIFPGVILFLTLLAFNYVGDGVNELLETQRLRDHRE